MWQKCQKYFAEIIRLWYFFHNNDYNGFRNIGNGNALNTPNYCEVTTPLLERYKAFKTRFYDVRALKSIST